MTKKLLHNKTRVSRTTIHNDGGTLFSWRINGRDYIFPIQKIDINGTEKKRGGIPVCFPNFGPPVTWKGIDFPQHGFLRSTKLSKAYHTASHNFCEYQEIVGEDEASYFIKLSFLLMDSINHNNRSEHTLRHSLIVRSRNENKLPLCLGFHPYFRAKRKYFKLICDGKPASHQAMISKQQSLRAKAFSEPTPYMFNTYVEMQLSRNVSVRITCKDDFITKEQRAYVWSDGKGYICLEPVMHDPKKFGTEDGFYICEKEKRFTCDYTIIIKK